VNLAKDESPAPDLPATRTGRQAIAKTKAN
jgi:hypothetical protein